MYTVRHKVVDNYGNTITIETVGLDEVQAKHVLSMVAQYNNYRGGEVFLTKKGGK